MADFYKINPLVMIGVPTLRKSPLSWEWANTFYGMQIPLGSAVGRKIVYGKKVAEARQEMAEAAIAEGCDWVLFVGDDNIVPHNTFELLERHKKHIVTGVYWTKSYPRKPYLWKDIMRGPFEDWKYGEFFKVDWAGCDCLLVHTDVFKAMEKPWFSHEWTWTHEKPPIPLPTEDVYFYTKARDAGFDLWCDSACMCGHQDRQTLCTYGLDFTMKQSDRYKGEVFPSAKLIADIGCGLWSPEFNQDPNTVVRRYDIDPEAEPDILCDVRAIPEPDETFDAIYANHVLEHFFYWEVHDILAEWLRLLKKGGEIRISVPNMGQAAKEVLKAIEDPTFDGSYAFGMIWGTRGDAIEEGMAEVKVGEPNDNQVHKMGFTKPGFERLLSGFKCLGDIEVVEDGYDNERSLTATAIKKKSTKKYEILPVWNEIAERGNGKIHVQKRKHNKRSGDKQRSRHNILDP